MTRLSLVNIPAQQAILGSTFTPILGQYGVPIREFCNLFNINTKLFFSNLPINLYVIYKNKSIYLQNLKISQSFLVNFFIYKNKRITLKDIFLILVLELKSTNTFIDKDFFSKLKFKSLLKSKIAYVNSFGYIPTNT